jgi:hypothetical protein
LPVEKNAEILKPSLYDFIICGPSIKYRRNEIFIDVIEEVHYTISEIGINYYIKKKNK